MDLITYMLLKSNNLYAESFANMLGYSKYGQASNNNASKAIKDSLGSYIKPNNTVIKDGSGLSSLNQTTPFYMVNLLTQVYNSKIGRSFYNCLSTSGVDGTLAYRMGKNLRGKIHAKTGTIAGVSTLSGYLVTRKGNILSFSIMLNDLTKKQRINAKYFQDKTIKIFYENF